MNAAGKTFWAATEPAATVWARFADPPGVRVVAGPIPASVEGGLPERMCFPHLGLNNLPAKLTAPDTLQDRMTPGGVIALDDFGWRDDRDQHEAETAWFRTRGVGVLELPTGRGLVIRPQGASRSRAIVKDLQPIEIRTESHGQMIPSIRDPV